MELARRHGFPVPAVHEADDRDLVLERIDGPTMLAELRERPERLEAHARTLADLHERLHAIAAPGSLRAPFGEGSALLHLDLHPANVLLGRDGPVVIDWPAAARGGAEADAAQTWLLVATSRAWADERARRERFLATFLAAFDRARVDRILPAVAARRERDENVFDDERAAIRRVVARYASPRAAR
jgi:tRNA A-37 threonylcarbamoyl transferase component Bud32